MSSYLPVGKVHCQWVSLQAAGERRRAPYPGRMKSSCWQEAGTVLTGNGRVFALTGVRSGQRTVYYKARPQPRWTSPRYSKSWHNPREGSSKVDSPQVPSRMTLIVVLSSAAFVSLSKRILKLLLTY